MSGLKKLLVKTMIISLLLTFSGCVAQATADTIARLEEEGIIALYNPDASLVASLDLIQVTAGDLVQNWMVTVNVVFPRTYHMHFEVETFDGSNSNITFQAWQNGHFSGIPWRVGDAIYAGEFIAELSFYESESIIIDRFALSLEKDQFEISFQNERQNRQQEIENLRNAPDNTEINILRLSGMELEYTQFLRRSDNTRQNFANRLYNLNAPTRAERIYAPINGRIIFNTQHTQPGMFRDVPNAPNVGRRVVTIEDNSYPHFMATPMHLHILRYGDIVPVQVIGQTPYFHAIVAIDPMVQNIRREGSHLTRLIPVCDNEFAVFLRELDYLDIDLVSANLQAQPIVPLTRDGILLESRAIIAEGNSYFVMLYENGNLRRRYVELGPSFGLMVQILSGLSPGQQVMIP